MTKKQALIYILLIGFTACTIIRVANSENVNIDLDHGLKSNDVKLKQDTTK